MVLRRQSRDVQDSRQTAPSGSAHLTGSEQSPATLVPLLAVRFPPSPNRFRIDHANAGIGQPTIPRLPSTESYRRSRLHGQFRFTLGLTAALAVRLHRAFAGRPLLKPIAICLQCRGKILANTATPNPKGGRH